MQLHPSIFSRCLLHTHSPSQSHPTPFILQAQRNHETGSRVAAKQLEVRKKMEHVLFEGESKTVAELEAKLSSGSQRTVILTDFLDHIKLKYKVCRLRRRFFV